MNATAVFDYEDLSPLLKHRRDELVNYLSEPEKVTTSGLLYRRFLRSQYMESCLPERAPLVNGQYLFSTYGINNTSIGPYTGEIDYPRAVTGVIQEFPGFLKISSNGRFRFFRTYVRSFEPLERQQLSVHVFEDDNGLIPLLLKEMSQNGSHLSCYGVWRNPVIYNGDFREVMKGRFWDDINPNRVGSREMSFWGDFLVFMEPGAFYFQRLGCHRPESAKILEPDFRKRES
ncbi:hypothetical protein [Succinimonas amylolytica]|uniref:hypothetical protein n=1 Tax=Succinimonas amylolytica TaxID=83769 RepID=UPI000370FEA3|nr:hypothetical protein [Succinimonas amylolytica]